MKFTESNTIETHLRDFLAGIASVRPAQLSLGFARAVSKIVGLGCCIRHFDLSSVAGSVEGLI